VGTPVVSQVTATTAKVAWQTTTAVDAWFVYGPLTEMDYEKVDPTLSTSHTVSLTGLNPSTTYYFFPHSHSGMIASGIPASGYFRFRTADPDPLQPIDLKISAEGGRHIVQGHSLYLTIRANRIAGPAQPTTTVTFGVPAGLHIALGAGLYNECGAIPCVFTQAKGGGATFMVTADASAPLGVRPLVITAVAGGVTRQLNLPLTVDPVPPPLPSRPIATAPPIPNFALWESHMTTQGRLLCDEKTILGYDTWEGNVWYYDGERVYYQIADYTKDSSWNLCAGYSEEVYRAYVLKNNGAIPAWRLFPHGLALDYARTGDAASLQAIDLLVKNASFAGWGGDTPHHAMRETSYTLDDRLIALKMGLPSKPIDRPIDMLLGMFDQLFVSRTTIYLKPFLIGLASEALIAAYERTADARIPPALKKAADALWADAWVEADQAFYYDRTENRWTGEPNLSLLVAPLYAWLWVQTGDPIYQERGDKLFAQGVAKAWIARGKEFNQSYRWSFDYVRWRKLGAFPPESGPLPVPVVQSWPDTLPAGGTLSVDNAASYVNASFVWTFTPAFPATSVGGASVAGTPVALSFNSGTSPRFTPSGLSPGLYHVSVYAIDNQDPYKRSQAMAKDITLLGADALGALTVYPNPWRKSTHAGGVFFGGLSAESTIKIFTVSGHLMKELRGAGQVSWDLTTQQGDRAASGIYLYVVTSPGEKRRGKVALLR
jgi:hypothetical protein